MEITAVMVQTYLKEFIVYQRTQVPKSFELSDYASGANHVLDIFEDAVDDCIDMIVIIMNKSLDEKITNDPKKDKFKKSSLKTQSKQ